MVVKSILLLVAACSFIGCASQRTTPRAQTERSREVAAPISQPSLLGPVAAAPSILPPRSEEASASVTELDSIPIEINSNVEKWIAYFQGRGRPHMERYLARSTRYMPLMQSILRENGLPEDLIYIALIESGFSSRATSRAAAVGYWQFIRPTGKRYGLQINTLIDERRDPELSTRAAAAYFKDLYGMFGSWYLAMASYNVGEGRVKREVTKNQTRDFWTLAARRRLPKETINYVPKYLAAKLIAKNPAQYGFTDIEYEDPIAFDLLKVNHGVNLRQMAEQLGLDYTDFKQMNPKFRGEVAPPEGSNLTLRIPLGARDQALVAATTARVDKIEFVADAGETQTYRVRAGDSLSTIARKFRTTTAWLRDVNDLKKGRKLRIGQRLQVPERSRGRVTPTQVAASRGAKASEPEVEKKAEKAPEIVRNGRTYYIVQRGDTLSSIAEEYDSTVSELRRMNKMSRRSVLRAGLRLRVPKVESLPSEPEIVGGSRASAASQGARAKGPGKHVVRPGESLIVIAKKYGVTVQAIIAANQLKNRAVLPVGRELVIPFEEVFEGAKRQPAAEVKRQALRAPKAKTRQRVHVVRRGENLSQIAGRYGVTVKNLKVKNDLEHPRIMAGMRLTIPE